MPYLRKQINKNNHHLIKLFSWSKSRCQFLDTWTDSWVPTGSDKGVKWAGWRNILWMWLDAGLQVKISLQKRHNKGLMWTQAVQYPISPCQARTTRISDKREHSWVILAILAYNLFYAASNLNPHLTSACYLLSALLC